ncbi:MULTISPECIES: dihydrolipoamide acetyltransferase family protein [Bacillus]|uniref:Dihydrolipoamide acetyltransferase component of pyruvate dehydrogenase complex n=1 Tax=Bacillus cereus (strain ATCC 14579 / DSM 31 / CCUG 7414 / JCM 2152 / NBRC 15305 / NCIMB 9373 / NCTC 2599 / NRRL B-3711) TaxID=226900 RepID=Q81CI7_BACCR|nr:MULTISPECIES: dihydrolipoamide acetyltransferase family protein [Bacillus cereus group]AAP09730.1 Dihydrolipoamide acetyltransferase component of acetoin dehydrogenase complex [Bacillus cereus ATCC 14579]EEL11247.1 Dihydrolipoyllysine-residue acetyltransferase component of acetoin cleaving system [Bacillus cereus BDRD-Cer4]ETT75316.1 branched-chain alpha-keto acid dehydrogenase subunit E2 [Bacillus cereus]KZD82944.1 Dihydrolipoamide acetyltransferase component (E2) of acetoin dehydrogenase c
MAVEVVMPKLGMAMKEGIITNWNIKAGDNVAKGELIASINSEKIETEIEAPADGTVLDIAVSEDEGVPPGTVICYIGKPNEKVEMQESTHVVEEKTFNIEVQNVQNQEPNGKEVAKQRIKISPVAKKIAKSENLGIKVLVGTGPGGRITKADVLKALEVRGIVPEISEQEESNVIPVTGMRKAIANRMHASLQNSAQLTLTMKVDVTDLVALHKEIAKVVQKRYDNKLTITDFVSRAAVLALGEHKEMNSAYIDDAIHQFEHVHLGMAVALEKGLIVPAIRFANNLSLVELSKEIKNVAQKARAGSLSSDDMHGTTFTISNLGSFGIEYFTPVLNTPETGILGIGAIEHVPVYKGKKLKKGSMLPLSLTFDHRVLDGAPAAAFLRTIKHYLEEPITILL